MSVGYRWQCAAAISLLSAVLRAVGITEKVCLKVSVHQAHAVSQGHDKQVGVLRDASPSLRLET